MSDKYESWKEKARKHDLYHDPEAEIRWKEDYSCKECHPYIVTNKRFGRFWKWYKSFVPEVRQYTGKTEEIFTELLGNIEEEQSEERDNEIKGKIGKLLGRMRYEESPKLTEKEIRRELIIIIAASNNFERSMKKTQKIYEEYISSEGESQTSGNVSEIEEANGWYEDLQQIVKDHKVIHNLKTESSVRDLSCKKCYSINKKMENNEDFMTFWNWYKEITTATEFSGETYKTFKKLKRTMDDETLGNEEHDKNVSRKL